MAFEGLSSRLQEITRKLKGKARITDSDLKEVLREVKIALLEADVNYKIVKDFVKIIEEKALGQDVLKSLTPGQQVVKIVKDELVQLLGGEESKISFSSNPPTIIMLVGLQGSGKTTTAGKLANLIRKQGKNPLLVACDVYRPAAIKQLQVVGKQLNIPVYANEQTKDVVMIAKQAKSVAISKLNDVIILDTAGRLHVDEDLMQELKDLKSSMHPHEILLVVDSMTGQDAVNVAEKFNTDLGVDGVVLTKLDGDTRGGAALSVKKVTGRPIKFAATGEKLSDIEEFHPERMASRILGMGDILSVIEKAEEAFDEECWKSFLIEYGDKPKKRVDYSKTNISLDFNISWEMKARKLLEKEFGVYISNCDFSYVDLSTIDTSYFRKIKKSNFSHTNLVLPSSLGNIQSPIFTYTDLTGNNLEGITIKLIDIVTTGGSLIGLGCNLAGTRISLILDGSAFQNKQVQDNLRTILASGDLDGCFINDKIVFSREEKQERAQHKLQEYEEFKQKKFSEISKLIQSQAKPK